MKNIFVWLYEATIAGMVLRYKLRVRMVPVSYKLFLVFVGGIIGSAYTFAVPMYMEAMEGETVTIEVEQFVSVPVVHAEDVPEDISSVESIADYIFMKESSRGKNNFSKCEAVGKFNRYGFGIPGNGSFLCFDGDGDRRAVIGWIEQKRAAGLSDSSLLCLYNTGKASEDCAYIAEF